MTFVKATSEPSAVDRERQRRRSRRTVALSLLAIPVLGWASYAFAPNLPFDEWSLSSFPLNMEEQFKYGSIGSDIEKGLPIDILLVLPKVFPQYLPAGAPQDLGAFGFLTEPGHELPIGFSRRRRIVDLTGLNCASCHTGLVRESADDPGRIIPAMPSNTVDVGAFFRFLFLAASDDRFTVETLLPVIKEERGLTPIGEVLMAAAIPQVRAGLMAQKQRVWQLIEDGRPEFGPGRVDSFNSVKLDLFRDQYPAAGLPDAESVGTNEFPSTWNQGVRRGMHLHWDGNNASVDERNVSAAMGVGATPQNVDLPRLKGVMEWLYSLPPPKYPFEIDSAAAARGAEVYKAYCHDCHDLNGKFIGTVVPADDIGTDRNRLDSYTEQLAGLQRSFNRKPDGTTYEWSFESFTKTNGYANAPLDGIWARAPYLHNGSVATMRDLLLDEELRPATFYRGHAVYDKADLGIRKDVTSAGGRPAFLFKTELRGNGKQGHTGEAYGTRLPDDRKRDLIEFLKTQ